MLVHCEIRNGSGLVSISNSLNAAVAGSFLQQVGDWLQTVPDVKLVVLDLGAVSFMDSSGLGAMISIFKRLAARGGKVVVARPQSAVKLMLQITRADQILRVYDTVEDAMQAREN